jgi:type IV secretory pathway VirJ component
MPPAEPARPGRRRARGVHAVRFAAVQHPRTHRRPRDSVRRLGWLLPAALLGLRAAPGAAQRDALTGIEETEKFGRFGTVHLYRETRRPARVVLFVSGDGGLTSPVLDMARELAGLDALVAGVDVSRYLEQLDRGGEACADPAADFAALARALQKKLGYPRYVRPVLVGHSTGATLVYLVLAQAPASTFRGGLSLGFCRGLRLAKPLCRGGGFERQAGAKEKGVSMAPLAALETPWIALQGAIDRVCDPAETERFVNQVAGGQIVMLPGVGHGFSVPRDWLPQFREAFLRLVESDDAGEPLPSHVATLHDLPLVEVPATAAGTPARSGSEGDAGAPGDSSRVTAPEGAHGPRTSLLALLLTGNEGYGGTDERIARLLAESGVPVVALNSLHYFWTARTAQGTAADIARVLGHYLALWEKEGVIFVGHAFGAEVLPFALNCLPEDLRARARALALLGSSPGAELQFGDWLGGQGGSSLSVGPEIERLRGLPILCFHGTWDLRGPCRDLDSTLVRAHPIRGGSRFGPDGPDYEGIVEAILDGVR